MLQSRPLPGRSGFFGADFLFGCKDGKVVYKFGMMRYTTEHREEYFREVEIDGSEEEM